MKDHVYIIIFIVVVLLFGLLALLTLANEAGRDWTKTDTHIAEFEKTLKAVDDGLHSIDMRLETLGHPTELHAVRAHYLHTRANLLYHINNLSPPHDFVKGE